jgi:hypothetical protein
MKKALWITIVVLAGLLCISILITVNTASRLNQNKTEQKNAELAFDNYLDNLIAGRMTEWEGRIKVFAGQAQQHGVDSYNQETTALFTKFNLVRKALDDLKKKTGKAWFDQKDKTIALFNDAENGYNRLRDQLK